MKRYLLTGAAGNLGSSVVRELKAAGASIRALVLPGDRCVKRLPEDIELCCGDVTKPESLAQFFRHDECDELIVIHMAGIVTTYPEFVQKVYDVNVTGVKNIVEACIENSVKKLVYVSSVHAISEQPRGVVITEPSVFDPGVITGFYGKTKAEASQYVLNAVRERGLNASMVFPSGLCGPHDYTIGHLSQLLMDYVQNKLPAGITGGYDFVDVRDVARGIVACANIAPAGESYIMGNRYVSVKEIFRLVHEITGAKEIKLMFPIWVAEALVPAFELYYRLRKQKPLFTRYSLYVLRSNCAFSHEKAARELGYTARPFDETVADALAWLRAEGYFNRTPRRTIRDCAPRGVYTKKVRP